MSGDSLDQNEIERLLSGIGGGDTPPPPKPPAEEGGILSQDELNALFGGGGLATPSAAKPETPPTATAWEVPTVAVEATEDDEEEIPRGDLDYLAKKADESLRSIATSPMNLPAEVIEFQFPEFGGTVPSTEHATLDLISEVDLDVKVELGRTYMYIEDVLRLRRGSVVPLDKMAGETVDIFINGRLLARGEVLVMNENFCVRVAELLAGAIPME